MGWRTVVVSGRAKLDLKMNHLVVRKDSIVKIHIKEIYMLIIESTTVSMTMALLSELSREKVKVIFCDEKHNPFGELTSYYNKHNTSLMVKNQIAWKPNFKVGAWTEIVRNKIENQAMLLEKNGFKESLMLRGYLEELKQGDSTNREGHAAKVYFNALFGMDFSRGMENSVNAALNFGYSVILSAFNREVCCNGYITQLGIFHDNQFNQYNLSSDLMEPFRPFVDDKVFELGPIEFGKEEKLAILELMEEQVVVGDRLCSLQNAIEIYSRSIFDAIEEENLSLIKRVCYEL